VRSCGRPGNRGGRVATALIDELEDFSEIYAGMSIHGREREYLQLPPR
jgi:hypothetical protein